MRVECLRSVSSSQMRVGECLGGPPLSWEPGMLRPRSHFRACLTLLCLVAQWCLTLCDPTDCSLPGSSVRGDSPGKNTGVGCHAFLQGIFPTQGSNPGHPQCRKILYHLSPQGSPWPDKFLVVNGSTPGGRAGNKFCSRARPDAIQSWNPMHVLEKD